MVLLCVVVSEDLKRHLHALKTLLEIGLAAAHAVFSFARVSSAVFCSAAIVPSSSHHHLLLLLDPDLIFIPSKQQCQRDREATALRPAHRAALGPEKAWAQEAVVDGHPQPATSLEAGGPTTHPSELEHSWAAALHV